MPEEQQAAEEIKSEPSLADFKKSRNEGVAPEEPIEKEKPEDQPEDKAEDKPKVKGGFQKKIDRLIKHNAELETAKEAAERERDELRIKNGKTEEKPVPKADGEPKIEDFSTMEEFYRAQARWEVRQELKAQEEAKEKSEEEAYTKEIFDNHNRTISEARAKYDDFEEVVKATDTPWKDGSKADVMASQAFAVAMFESGIGGELLYYLAKNPAELAKMGGLSPAKVQMAVGRIVDKLEAAENEEPEEQEEETEEKEEQEEPKSKLPTPITPVGRGSARTSKSLSDTDLPLSEFKKQRQAGKIR